MNHEVDSTPGSARTAVAVWPAIKYRDAKAAIEFLKAAFGFTETAVYTDGDAVAHAELSWPLGGAIMLGSVRPGSDLADQPIASAMIYLLTDDPDALYRRATDAGATIVRELVDQDYGSREFTCRDPEGVFWSFGTYAGAAAE